MATAETDAPKKDPAVVAEEQRQRTIEKLKELRLKKREDWQAYWQVMDYNSRGRPLTRFHYYYYKMFDAPVTWWREHVVEPLQDRFGHWPYYHRRFSRVPTIDECGVNDKICEFEANMQYKLDKLVDSRILKILTMRKEDCLEYHHLNYNKCIPELEDFEEAELNYFIKYGELGIKGSALMCYMKQKHRMVWERRHPEIMAERQRGYEEHKKLIAKGIYDEWFWKRDNVMQYKEASPNFMIQGGVVQDAGEVKAMNDAISQNPEYYRQKKEAEEKGEFKQAKPWHVYP